MGRGVLLQQPGNNVVGLPENYRDPLFFINIQKRTSQLAHARTNQRRRAAIY